MPFVLRVKPDPYMPYLTEYFTGKTYVHQRETYAVVRSGIENAKVYKTKAGAQKSADALDQKVWNYTFVVHETK